MPPPQAFMSALAPRARGYLNSFLVPVLPQQQTAPISRKTNRGTNIINYAEDLLADEDFDESDGPRRATGLRSRAQADPNQTRDAQLEKLTTELTSPVEVQGIWRDWMGKPRFGKYEDSGARSVLLDFESTESSQLLRRTEVQLATQASLPLTLIPIRIDLDIPSFAPPAALPLPPQHAESGIDPSAPAYRQHEPTTAFRLRDFFMWNLHEAMLTPDQFALTMVHDLDLPAPTHYAGQISSQIRQQCEEYAGVAMHPLFHTKHDAPSELPAPNGSIYETAQTPVGPATPMAAIRSSSIRPGEDITAKATPMPSGPPDMYNPDDMYRCIVTLNVYLLNKLYTDKFEWSLLHPAGAAEAFALQTCADLGLHGEWVPAMTHAIYESVLRLKKEACESGGLVGGGGLHGEIENLAVPGQEAGWRYDDEGLAEEWEPKIEILSKDEIEKREGDRERQVRRQRRETARFSSTANMAGGVPTPGSYFDQPDGDTPMGRGERSKKKRRFRSLSPTGRGGTPGGTSEAAGWGGGGGGPTEEEKSRWRCAHCQTWGNACWAIRDGPTGPRSLCNNCGLYYERDKVLPRWLKDFHQRAQPPLLAYR